MRFCPWYPLADALAHLPAGENVLQLRVAEGLVDYPRGKSAMVLYAHAPDIRAAAHALIGAHAHRDLLCRHLIEIDEATDLGTFCAKLREDFVRRFGARPMHE
ncbi:MAG: hypothetical protein H0T79_12235 [Deltaproteobacteria bacterium]|nr:hypothetical protein [Deltaproteobacteria bacterium]